jgi:hypothetical protein
VLQHAAKIGTPWDNANRFRHLVAVSVCLNRCGHQATRAKEAGTFGNWSALWGWTCRGKAGCYMNGALARDGSADRAVTKAHIDPGRRIFPRGGLR